MVERLAALPGGPRVDLDVLDDLLLADVLLEGGGAERLLQPLLPFLGSGLTGRTDMTRMAFPVARGACLPRPTRGSALSASRSSSSSPLPSAWPRSASATCSACAGL